MITDTTTSKTNGNFKSLNTRRKFSALISKIKLNKLSLKQKKFAIIGIVFIFLLLFIAGLRSNNASGVNLNSDSRAVVAGAKATQTLNNQFSFPLYDADGKEVTKLTYLIENAELRDEIIVQGKTAKAVQGKTFLILTIKINNTYDKAIDINTRDYIRLTVNGKTSELIAADIHNDPVSVQAISTKTTRIGFPINDTDKNLVIIIGEIKGSKEQVALNLK